MVDIKGYRDEVPFLPSNPHKKIKPRNILSCLSRAQTFVVLLISLSSTKIKEILLPIFILIYPFSHPDGVWHTLLCHFCPSTTTRNMWVDRYRTFSSSSQTWRVQVRFRQIIGQRNSHAHPLLSLSQISLLSPGLIALPADRCSPRPGSCLKWQATS